MIVGESHLRLYISSFFLHHAVAPRARADELRIDGELGLWWLTTRWQQVAVPRHVAEDSPDVLPVAFVERIGEHQRG